MITAKIYGGDYEVRWVRMEEDRRNPGRIIGRVVEEPHRGLVAFVDESSAWRAPLKPGEFAAVAGELSANGRVFRGRVAHLLVGEEGARWGHDRGPVVIEAASLEEAKAKAKALCDRAVTAGEAEAAARAAVEQGRLALAAAKAARVAQLPAEEAALVRTMEGHDWHYSYSDDGNVWKAGEAHWQRIRQAALAVPLARRQELWHEFAPEDHRDCVPQ